jgi:hypothetical protein
MDAMELRLDLRSGRPTDYEQESQHSLKKIHDHLDTHNACFVSVWVHLST